MCARSPGSNNYDYESHQIGVLKTRHKYVWWLNRFVELNERSGKSKSGNEMLKADLYRSCRTLDFLWCFTPAELSFRLYECRC
jgi:hypothetical protein